MWGNPFKITGGGSGTRDGVSALFREWVVATNLDVEFLRGKDLVCWCYPLACHGDVLVQLSKELQS